MSASAVKVNGVWRTAGSGYVKINGVWRVIATSYTRVNGVWRVGTLGAPPAAPIVAHSGYGQFTIANYDPGLTYTLTRVSGSGEAVQAGALITLNQPDARFRVTVGFAAAAPQSAAAFVERKAYTYTLTNQPYPCGTHQCNCNTSWNACGCGSCDPYPAPKSPSWGQCGCPGDMCWYNGQSTTCSTCTSYCDNWVNVKNATPAGYADAFGEWSKVS